MPNATTSRVFLLFVFSLLGWASVSQAQISLGGQIADSSRLVNVAVVDFAGQDTQGLSDGASLSAIIRDDLSGSGLFQVADQSTYPQSAVQIDSRPDFNRWAQTGLDALVSGRVVRSGTKLRVEYRLFDLKQRRALNGFAFTAERRFVREMAHLIADNAYEVLTGAPGHFSTKIVFVSEEGTATNRVKRLAIMDHDGANFRYLLPSSSNLNLTPRFSPVSPEITYMSYEDGLPKVYLLNIDTLQREVLGEFAGMTFSPRFTPDGKSVVFSLSTNGQSDLYEMDLRTRRQQRLTGDSAIDTSPSFSPDGRKIVFESDRSGSQQLYVMNRDGSNVERISFGEGRYASPVWSPDGRSIAFTRIAGGEFIIGVMDADGRNERDITRGFHVEGPSWAPNSRMLTYYKQSPQNADGSGGVARIYVVDIFSGQERLLPTPGGASDPAWSPKIL